MEYSFVYVVMLSCIQSWPSVSLKPDSAHLWYVFKWTKSFYKNLSFCFWLLISLTLKDFSSIDWHRLYNSFIGGRFNNMLWSICMYRSNILKLRKNQISTNKRKACEYQMDSYLSWQNSGIFYHAMHIY